MWITHGPSFLVVEDRTLWIVEASEVGIRRGSMFGLVDSPRIRILGQGGGGSGGTGLMPCSVPQPGRIWYSRTKI